MDYDKEDVGIKIQCRMGIVYIRVHQFKEKGNAILLPQSQRPQLIDMLNELNNAMNKDEQEVWPGTNKEAMIHPLKRKTRGKHIGLLQGFDRFWTIYPRKVCKPTARAAWAKLDPSTATLEVIIKSVESHKRAIWSEHLEVGGNKKWIPYPATWLNAQRWEDEVEIKNEPRRKLTWKEVAEARHQKAMNKSDSPQSHTGPIPGRISEMVEKIVKTTVKEQESTTSNGKNTDDKTEAS